jgi:hypothetical protein
MTLRNGGALTEPWKRERGKYDTEGEAKIKFEVSFVTSAIFSPSGAELKKRLKATS